MSEGPVIPAEAVTAAMSVLGEILAEAFGHPLTTEQEYGKLFAARAILEAAEPAIRTAERERLAIALLGCVTCGRIHESRRSPAGSKPDPGDGHPYRPRSPMPPDCRAELTGETP